MAKFKKYLAYACLFGTALVSLAASAQSVELYGLMDLGIGPHQLPRESRRHISRNGALTTSFIRFLGNEDLGASTSANFSSKARASFTANDSNNRQFATAYDLTSFQLYARYNMASLANYVREIQLRTGQGSAGIPFGLSTTMVAEAKT